jgi:Glycosyl hydrolase family 26
MPTAAMLLCVTAFSMFLTSSATAGASAGSTASRAVPRALKVASAASVHADRVFVDSARTLRRCQAFNHARKGACRADRRRLQVASVDLTHTERTLAGIVKSSDAQASAARTSAHANRQAPKITVSGLTLTWPLVDKVSSYDFVRKVPGEAPQYSVIKGGSIEPPQVPGKTVRYSVRTAVEGSAWAPEVSISYPAVSPPSEPLPSEPVEQPVKTEPVEQPVKTEPVAPAGSALTGVYVGAADPSDASSFAKETGAPIKAVLDYLPSNTGSWAASVEEPAYYVNGWVGSGDQLTLSVPMLPSSSYTLAAGAAGTYDQYWKRLAENLVAEGAPNQIVRPGWEMNGSWYPWTISGGSAAAANYAAYFKQIVTTMRAVSPGFKFDWCANMGDSSGANPAAAWPGAAYVNYIGMDVYDRGSKSSTAAQNWQSYLTMANGLNWLSSFSAEQGKPIVFDEWGLEIKSSTEGAGDDPAFIEDMATFIKSHNVAYADYFDFDEASEQHAIDDGKFPKSLAAYKLAFG